MFHCKRMFERHWHQPAVSSSFNTCSPVIARVHCRCRVFMHMVLCAMMCGLQGKDQRNAHALELAAGIVSSAAWFVALLSRGASNFLGHCLRCSYSAGGAAAASFTPPVRFAPSSSLACLLSFSCFMAPNSSASSLLSFFACFSLHVRLFGSPRLSEFYPRLHKFV